jgi:hypothetical protein
MHASGEKFGFGQRVSKGEWQAIKREVKDNKSELGKWYHALKWKWYLQ